MEIALIKRWLLDGEYRVYSVIVEAFREKIDALKPLMFMKWLANEIDVPETSINLGSLNSALTRIRRKEKKNKQYTSIAHDAGASSASADKPLTSTFTFSDPDQVLPSNPGTKEY